MCLARLVWTSFTCDSIVAFAPCIFQIAAAFDDVHADALALNDFDYKRSQENESILHSFMERPPRIRRTQDI